MASPNPAFNKSGSLSRFPQPPVALPVFVSGHDIKPPRNPRGMVKFKNLKIGDECHHPKFGMVTKKDFELATRTGTSIECRIHPDEFVSEVD